MFHRMNNESRIREKFSRPGRARERKTASGRGFWGMGTDYRALRRARVGPSLRPLAQHVETARSFAGTCLRFT